MNHDEIAFSAYQTEIACSIMAPLNADSCVILDFGCSVGTMAHFIQRAFAQAAVYGIDNDAAAIASAQENYPEITFIQNNGQKLPFSDAYFDCIYAAQVLHHIPVEQREALYVELLRVLKPGGKLIFFELNPCNRAIRRTVKQDPAERDAHLIYPWALRRSFMKRGLHCSLGFYGSWISWCDRYPWVQRLLSYIPFSQLYVVLIT